MESKAERETIDRCDAKNIDRKMERTIGKPGHRIPS